MTNLKQYDLLVSDVFYRGYHILDYIESKHNISDLDKEAISATIMDALVYKKLIDPQRQSLNLENMCICDDTSHYCYQTQPFVTSIPLQIKEQMRKKCLKISGGIPVSVFYSKPASGVHFCIYDMNTAFSAFFEDFTFIDCDYESPTREGVITKDRPFVEVSINGTNYLVDALTKRVFRSDLFKERFGLKIKRSVSKKDFDLNQKHYYEYQTSENINYATLISLLGDMWSMDSGATAERTYEFIKSKIYFPEEFAEAELIKQEVNQLDDEFFLKGQKKI